MKCLVLAGGSSDRLWPLSRKEFPKQFMPIRENRSMFQETILRNVPHCDEFIILTNKRYENVARGQLQVFQGIEYSFILEDKPLKTALAVFLYIEKCEPDEELLIVSTDSIIEGDYKTTVTQLKEEVKDGKFSAVVSKTVEGTSECNYVNIDGKCCVFGGKKTKNSLYDCGIMGAKASVLIDCYDKRILKKYKTLKIDSSEVKNLEIDDLYLKSLNKVIVTTNYSLIQAKFSWTRITDISSFYNYYVKSVRNNKNTITNKCKGIEIVNMVDEQLIVANGIKNIAIVNTRDAVYITSSAREADVKDIASHYYTNKKKYFDNQPNKYETWGSEQIVGSTEDCKVKVLNIYQHESCVIKNKKNTIINLFITQGNAHFEGISEDKDYEQYSNINISDIGEYRLINSGKVTLTVVYTEKLIKCGKINPPQELLVKMQPVFKDNLWGGTKIRDVFGKDVGNLDVIGESWELSAHSDDESKIAFGQYAGKTLSEYIDAIGTEKLGWKAQTYDKFPIMIKFIDARDNLSIQVHPADDYALSVEGEYGKNEMWHILDADEDAYIYVGFKYDVTEEEIRQRIENNTLLQVINKIPVKKNETYFLKAGIVHAIGSGCLICEIQQSSNITYRLYDYGRTDKNGQQRELHIDKALDVLDMHKYVPQVYEYEAITRSEYVKMLIGQCKYFTVNKYYIDGECTMPRTQSSFQAYVILEGSVTISDSYKNYTTSAGDTWFCASNEQVTLFGKGSLLVVNI